MNTRAHNSIEAVLLVGSGYGALKVAEDLVQSGIPVAWVTKSPHYLELPLGAEALADWPADLDYQFRPLYLRVTRHPLLTALPQARILSAGNGARGFVVEGEQDPRYIDYDLCTGCGKCTQCCPLNDSERPPITRRPAQCPTRALVLDKRATGACRVACPLGVNAQAYLALTAAQRFDEALAVVREANPLPGICGRVCHHPCEAECRRAEVDEAVAIRDIKRFLADFEAHAGVVPSFAPPAQRRTERVAVIGSGPAGLTAAHYLNREGFQVTVFESLPQAGGMLRAGINSFRLPRRVLDIEIKAIENAGVTIQTGTTVTSVQALLAEGFGAVLLAAGTQADLQLGIPGENLPGINACVSFLRAVNLYGTAAVGAKTVVVGAGNSAMDAARTALRLGAASVTVVGIEQESELPAHPREVREAREEGVAFVLGAAPIAFEGTGALERVVCCKARWQHHPDGSQEIVHDREDTFSLDADCVIVAIGQRPQLKECGLDREILTGPGGRALIDTCYATPVAGVFAAGDVASGPSTVVEAMAAGRAAAGSIMEHLTGQASSLEKNTAATRGVGDSPDIPESLLRRRRPDAPQRLPRVRCRDFDEVDMGLGADEAVAEAKRCLQCSVCCECRACEEACEQIGAINHFSSGRQFTIEAPAIIVADAQELPDAGLLDRDQVFRVADLKHDLTDVMLSGSAAAGRAMVAAAKLRRAAVPQETDVEDLSDEVRIGFFLCTCNDTLASRSALERVRELAGHVRGVVHSQLLMSACHPAGADMIAEAVGRHTITRVVLASCVCCPLEFQCISCNDQRTRARLHLFERLGLPRSRFETINLRDSLLAERLSDDEVVEKARDLLRASFVRARYMAPLTQGRTEIGKQVIVLGGGDIGRSCALNLDLQGFRVRLVHNPQLETDPPRRQPHQVDASAGNNITHVDSAIIRDIRGQMGDFTIYARQDGAARRWRADIVCLVDEAVLPLALNEDAPGLKKLYRYDFAFFHTPQAGMFRVLPRTLERVQEFEAGAALAAQVARSAAEAFLKDHLLSPRVDPQRCRGCGRCVDICPFNAIQLIPGLDGMYTAEVARHNCVGCGGCVGRCPVTALDMPYFSNQLLEALVADALAGGKTYNEAS